MRKKKIVLLIFAVAMFGLLGACDREEQVNETNQSDVIGQPDATKQTEETDEIDENEFAGERYETENTVASFTTPNAAGSCIVLYAEENKLLVATASHVAEKMETVLINKTEAKVIDYWKSSDFDLMYLWVETERQLPLSEAYPSVNAFNELQEDSYISVLGIVADEKVYQEGTVLNCWIYMEDFGYHMLWGDVSGVKGGMSGGAVFDADGRLIGMLCGSDGESEIAVLPVSIMEAEWKNSGRELSIDIFAD